METAEKNDHSHAAEQAARIKGLEAEVAELRRFIAIRDERIAYLTSSVPTYWDELLRASVRDCETWVRWLYNLEFDCADPYHSTDVEYIVKQQPDCPEKQAVMKIVGE